MRFKTVTTLTLVALLVILAASPVFATESGSYKTEAGDLVEWIFVGPSPDYPDGVFSWTLTCHHCGHQVKGTGTPPEWDLQ